MRNFSTNYDPKATDTYQSEPKGTEHNYSLYFTSDLTSSVMFYFNSNQTLKSVQNPTPSAPQLRQMQISGRGRERNGARADP